MPQKQEVSDLREILRAMDEHNVEAIAQALFGKPTGINRVDKAIREVADMVDQANREFAATVDALRGKVSNLTPKQISDGVMAELQKDSGCDDGSY